MLSRRRSRGFYDPLSEMNRLVNQVFVGGLPRQAGTEQGTPGAGWAPSIDVVQRDDDLVVRAELPGARPEDVDITVHNGILTISGRVGEEREEERGGYLVRERRYGSFRRSLQLPQDVDESEINARFEDGVLEVTIKGAAAAHEPRRVQIEGQDGERRASAEGPSVRTSSTEEAPPRAQDGREQSRRQSERQEDEGLLDRAREAILGEEEEPRRGEETGRPEDRR
jgi:HSP20 family protein